MDEKVLNLIDEFQIDDSHSQIRGFLVVEKSDGTVVFKKENMVTLAGRKYVKSLIASKIKTDSSVPDKTIKYLAFGTDGKLSRPTGNTLTVPNKDKIFDIGSATVTVNTSPEANNQAYIKLSCELVIDDGKTSGIFREAGLVFSTFNSTANSNITIGDADIFSRVVFAPSAFTENSTYTVNYYLYF